MDNITIDDFKASLTRHASQYYIEDRRPQVINNIMSLMQDSNPSLIYIGHVTASDLATMRAYFMTRSKELSSTGEKLAANDMNANANIITAVAKKDGIDIDFTPDLIRPEALDRLRSTQPAAWTTNYGRTIQKPEVRLKADTSFYITQRAEPRTPSALIKAGSHKRSYRIKKSRDNIDAIQLLAPKPEVALSAQHTTRPLKEISDAYKAVWEQIGEVCTQANLPMLTLTDATAKVPWLHVNEPRFEQNIASAKNTAEEFLNRSNATRISNLLDEIKELHDEYAQAKGHGKAIG